MEFPNVDLFGFSFGITKKVKDRLEARQSPPWLHSFPYILVIRSVTNVLGGIPELLLQVASFCDLDLKVTEKVTECSWGH